MNEPYKVLFADRVYDDLEEIHPKAANQLLKKIDLLKTFPLLGKTTESGYWHGYQFITDGYRILYTVNEANKTVNVYHIRHGKMYFH